jgi:hypothetical protein
MSKQYDVFLSYNSKDRKAVEDIARRLEFQHQIHVYLEALQLPQGLTQLNLDLSDNPYRSLEKLVYPDSLLHLSVTGSFLNTLPSFAGSLQYLELSPWDQSTSR